MRYVIKSIAIGLLIGSALFFLPFAPLLLLIALFFFIGARRRRLRRRMAFSGGQYGFSYNGPLPIDGFGNRPRFNRDEPRQTINVQ